MLAAGLIAYITRVNIPAAIAGTWISNPLTFPFCIYAQYIIGSWILGTSSDGITTHGVWDTMKHAPAPVLVGAFPAAAILAIIVYPVTLLLWDMVHARMAARQRARGIRLRGIISEDAESLPAKKDSTPQTAKPPTGSSSRRPL